MYHVVIPVKSWSPAGSRYLPRFATRVSRASGHFESMKLVIFALVLSAGIARAQPAPEPTSTNRHKVGARIGVGLANLDEDGAEDETENRTGLIVGGFVTIPIGPSLEIEIDALYSQKGAKFDGIGGGGTIALDYVSIPVLLAGTFPVTP